MTWTIRTDRDFDRALKKLDRPVATRVLKALTVLASIDFRLRRAFPVSDPFR